MQAWQIDDLISLDPAEVFEFTGAEYAANVYDRLVTYPPDDVTNLQGHVAESWEIADDGKTYTFKIRPGITFHTGNPLTAEDAACSLQRVVKLNQTPGFILTQFGFTPENVDERIKAIDDETFEVELDKPYAPTFLLYCLTATVRLGGRQAAGHGAREGRRHGPRLAARPTPPAPARSSCAPGSRTRA